MKLFKILFSIILTIGFCSTSLAQITATADVLSPISVSAGTNLDFGSVEATTGKNKTVNADGTGDAGTTAGEFTVTGASSNAVTLQFTALPDLTDGSGNTLTIDYNNSNYALWSTDADNATAADNTTFNPSTGTPTATLDSDGISVFIGGQAQPTTGQVVGTYNGTITLTATYN